MNLSGSQCKQLQEALIDAFPDKASLERMLLFELDKNLGTIALEGNLSQIVFDLIKTAQAENWVEGLINGARRANPGNQKLKDIVNGVWKDYQVKTDIPRNLPYSGVEQFVGRADKLELLHQELTDGQQIVITAIAGMGGIGKTELALQYALRYQDNYPGGLCWLQVRSKDLGVQIIDFARERINVNPPDDFELQGQVNYCWSHWKEGTALIVLDDVPKYGNFYRENILPYLPPARSRFKVLMTSRQRPDRGIREIDLDVLSPDAALELLKVLAGAERIEGEIEAAEALCKWLGYLPLGLELVGRYLDNHPTLTLVKVQQRLESKRLAARALLQQEYGNMTAQLGVAAAFELSWVELDQEVQQLSCLLSLFAPAPFNWELVEQCLPDTDEEDLEDIRDGYLLKFNLLQLAPHNTYRIHPLVREFLQAKLAQLESALQLKQAFTCVMAAIAKKIPQTPTRKEIELFKDNIPHLGEVAQNLTAVISDEDLPWVFTGLGWFYQGQGLYALAELWLEQCVSVVTGRLGNENSSVAGSFNNLALLYHSQGEYSKAESMYQQALELYKRLLGEDHPYVANSLNNLAELYRLQGRYTQAESLYQEALEMQKRLLGEEHLDVAISLNNLSLLHGLQGQYTQAEDLLQRVLELYKQLLGEDHPYVATSLNNLAELYRLQGRYAQAESLYQEVLEMKKRLLGEEHLDVATSLNNLAGLYVSQGWYTQAESVYQKALETYKRLLGEEHPNVAISLNNLALVYKSQGEYSKAEIMYQQSLSMRKSFLGENHPSVGISLNNLAELYKLQGEYSKAEFMHQQTLELYKQLLGEDHSSVALSLNNLAGVYKLQGEYSKAEPIYKQALSMRKRLLGKEHPDVATSLNDLANLYELQGRYEEAEFFHQQALELYKMLLGDEHPWVAISLNNLAELYKLQGEYGKAEPMYQKALDIDKRVLGEQHLDVAIDLNNLAGLYESQGRYSEAEPLYEQALGMFEKCLGVDHPNTVAVRNNLEVFREERDGK